MRRRFANPSSVISTTVAVPSTCPWTTCPPSRSSARNGSSRLTFEPGSSSPRVVSSSVWCMTSASKVPPVTEVAVRQAPLTATESPWLSSDARAADMRSRAPSEELSTASTPPSSLTMPVNISGSPFEQPRSNQHVLSDLFELRGQRMDALRDPRDALALQHGAGLGGPHQDRCDEEADLVDLARVEQHPCEGRPSFDQQVLNPAAAELAEGGLQPSLRGAARSDGRRRPGLLERVAAGGRRLG